MSDPLDASFGARLRTGDASVLEDVLRCYGPRLARSLLQRYTGRLQQCDIADAIITGLEHLWAHQTRFDAAKGTVRCWFRQIVLNAARDILKASAARVRHCGPLIDPSRIDRLVSGTGRGLSHRSARRSILQVSLQRQLLAILEELPQHQRHILLADAASPSGKACVRELAMELGLSESTVREYRRCGLKYVRPEKTFGEREREREREKTQGSVRMDRVTRDRKE
jgi:RNA polymerase sigma factor (sigma-70 family)